MLTKVTVLVTGGSIYFLKNDMMTRMTQVIAFTNIGQ